MCSTDSPNEVTGSESINWPKSCTSDRISGSMALRIYMS